MAIRLKPAITVRFHAARGFSTWPTLQSLAKVERRLAQLLQSLPGVPRQSLSLSAHELPGYATPAEQVSDTGSGEQVCLQRKDKLAGRSCPFHIFQLRIRTRLGRDEQVMSSSMALALGVFCETCPEASDFNAPIDDIHKSGFENMHRFDITDVSGPTEKAAPRSCRVPGDPCSSPEDLQPVNKLLTQDVLLELMSSNRAYADPDAHAAAKQAILAEGLP